MKSPHREALRWFLQAEDDWRFVEWALKEKLFFDKACFIAQQAGEKALKACLYAMGQRRVLGHSLHEMVLRLIESDSRFGHIAPEARRLDRFYISARYPNGLPGGSPFEVYDFADVENAYQDISHVISLCRIFLVDASVIQ